MEPGWKSLLRFVTNNILAGSTYEKYQQKFLSLQKIKLIDTQLVKDLEKLCQQNGGVLTFSEFFAEELYGRNGYYATLSKNVLTNTPPRWAEPIVMFCKDYGYHIVGELGPGNGALGLRILKAAAAQNYDMRWGGVEIAAELQKAIQKNFEKFGFTSRMAFLVDDVSHANFPKPALFVFPYSLDSVVPDVFINASSYVSYPTHILGVKVSNGILEEVLLSDEDFERKGISFKNGIYIDKSITLDLSQWRLSSMQRLYVSPLMFSILKNTVNALPNGSRILIIDEFRCGKGGYRSPHLLAPRNLARTDRDVISLLESYKNIGRTDYYFPLPQIESFVLALEDMGIDITFIESEYHAAAYIQQEKKLPIKTLASDSLSQCLLSSPLKKKGVKSKITLPFFEKVATSKTEH